MLQRVTWKRSLVALKTMSLILASLMGELHELHTTGKLGNVFGFVWSLAKNQENLCQDARVARASGCMRASGQ